VGDHLQGGGSEVVRSLGGEDFAGDEKASGADRARRQKLMSPVLEEKEGPCECRNKATTRVKDTCPPGKCGGRGSTPRKKKEMSSGKSRERKNSS